MSFLEYLTNGELPIKKDIKKNKLTPYDEFISTRNLKLKDKAKKIELLKPKSFTETESLIDFLKEAKGIVLDFSNLNPKDSQRMLDFLSGAVYALDGTIERIEQKVYLIAPKGVNIINKLKG